MAKVKSTGPKKFSYFENFRTAKALPFGELSKKKFLQVYAETGRLTYAAECALACGQTVRDHLVKDPEFAAAFEDAKNQFGDKLQAEINRRALEGLQEPVYNFRTNEIIDTVTKYSDRLLELASKRYVPEYRDKTQVDVNITPGVLVVTSEGGAMDPEEWIRRFTPAAAVKKNGA
jgi:hypothetical protein